MENFFKNSILEELFENRSAEFSHFIIKNSKEFHKLNNSMKEKISSLMRYVPERDKEEIQTEIEDFMFDNVLALSEFWNSRYYKIGFSDGLKVKKEVEESLKQLLNK